MDDSPLELAQMFADIATELSAQPTVAETLEETVRLAVDAVPGCDFAGVSWLAAGKRIETLAATDDVIMACDAAQYELNEGPGVESTWDADTYLVHDMAAEKRWPRFAAAAADLGVGSLLAVHLPAPRRVVGALNLYAAQAGSFDDDSRELAIVYAAHASIALANRRLESDLRTAVETRGGIGQAMGILIERHRLTPQQAFDLLVRVSQTRHIKLRDLANHIVETGLDPLEPGRDARGAPGNVSSG